MAAFLYLASPGDLNLPVPDTPTLLLDSSPEYWFLYRYFEVANLDRRHELVDLYGGGVIDGYQLHRLRAELEQALSDIEAKPNEWRVLVGWTGEAPSIETEDWRPTKKSSLVSVIQSLLHMIDRVAINDLKLVSSGD